MRGCRGFLLKKRCLRINLLVPSALVVVIENLSGGTHDQAKRTKMLC